MAKPTPTETPVRTEAKVSMLTPNLSIITKNSRILNIHPNKETKKMFRVGLYFLFLRAYFMIPRILLIIHTPITHIIIAPTNFGM